MEHRQKIRITIRSSDSASGYRFSSGKRGRFSRKSCTPVFAAALFPVAETEKLLAPPSIAGGDPEAHPYGGTALGLECQELPTRDTTCVNLEAISQMKLATHKKTNTDTTYTRFLRASSSEKQIRERWLPGAEGKRGFFRGCSLRLAGWIVLETCLTTVYN